MAPIRSLAALLALGSAAACTTHQERIATPSRAGLTSVNQPVVHRTDYVFDANTSGNGVSEAELHRLDGWFQSLQLGYGDRVAVDQAGYEDSAARSDIAGLAASYGLLLSDDAPLTAGPVRPGTVRIIVSRATATVPGCPNWTDQHEQRLINTGANYGCATNSNLAAMIADPGDLVLGQSGDGTVDAMTAAKAIKVYRDKVPTGNADLEKTSSKGGN